MSSRDEARLPVAWALTYCGAPLTVPATVWPAPFTLSLAPASAPVALELTS
jgi:hypothetical protein